MVENGDLLLDAFHSVCQIVIAVVSDGQLVVKVGDFFANLRASDLLLNLNRLDHECFSAGILLLLPKLHSDSLHCASLFLSRCCITSIMSIIVRIGSIELGAKTRSEAPSASHCNLDQASSLGANRERSGEFRPDRVGLLALVIVAAVH